MKCEVCGVEYSDKVCVIHQKKCKYIQQLQNVEIKKELTIPEDLNMEDITNLTKPKIVEALRQLGIKFNIANKREVLEALLLESMG